MGRSLTRTEELDVELMSGWVEGGEWWMLSWEEVDYNF